MNDSDIALAAKEYNRLMFEACTPEVLQIAVDYMAKNDPWEEAIKATNESVGCSSQPEGTTL